MADIKDKVLEEGKKWISDPANQKKAMGWGETAWSWIKGLFSKKS